MPETKTFDLKIARIQEALKATVLVGQESLERSVSSIYASDLMSDVLAHGKSGACLLTGLNTMQTAISSYMAEFNAIVFLRGKIPAPEIQKFALQKEMVVMSTKLDMFEACIKVAQEQGVLLPAPVAPAAVEEDEAVTRREFSIESSDFASAGLVSTEIKAILKEIGYPVPLIRRIAISVYEGEMNVYMHAREAKVQLIAGEKEIIVILDDKGKGIPDIELALKEGFSTATEEQRAMGFGAGMGLPNIKKNSDQLNISSEVGLGTCVEIRFNVI